MMLTDTHTHLFSKEFDADRDKVISDAICKNVTRFFVPNIDASTIIDTLKLSEQYPDNCFAMLGLHPCHVNKGYVEELNIIKEHLFGNNRILGIGETGLDYFHDTTFKKEQKEALEIQIKWAMDLKLPIILHTRDSLDDTVDILSKYKGKIKGIFHCFSGNLEQAQQVIDLGFYLGIGGVVTFKNSGLDKIINQIDIKNIVLETDSPYLAPVPFRGKRNESAYLLNVAEKVAEIYGLSVAEVANITTQNSIALFKI